MTQEMSPFLVKIPKVRKTTDRRCLPETRGSVLNVPKLRIGHRMDGRVAILVHAVAESYASVPGPQYGPNHCTATLKTKSISMQSRIRRITTLRMNRQTVRGKRC